jgi:outer membrane protein TolC
VALSAAVEAAWSRSVQAKGAEGLVELAVARQAAASSLWAGAPSIELSQRGDKLLDDAGRRESEIGFTWPLLLPGQGSARQTAADAERQLADATALAAKLRVAGEVREAVWAVAARDSEWSVAARHANVMEALAGDVERRVKAGDLAHADALAARAEFLAASAAADEARQRLDVARMQWKLLTGLDTMADAAEPARDTTEALHPEVALAATAFADARSRLERVRGESSDPPELTLRYRYETPGVGLPAEKSIGLGIRIPFGTSDRNLPREKAAAAQLEVARAEERLRRERVEGERETAAAAVRAAERQLESERGRARLLRERSGLIDKSFRAGESALPELLRAQSAAAQAEAALAGQQAALGLARARLNQMNGRLP